MYYRKMINYTSRTNRRQKVWILLEYPSNIDNFFNISHTKNIIVILKDVEFDFRMGCILILFPFLWIIKLQFTIYGFLDFWFFVLKIRKIYLFWSKITIFIIEISLKPHLCTKYGLNNLNSHRLAWKVKNLIFYYFWQLKNSSHTETFKSMSRAQFSL